MALRPVSRDGGKLPDLKVETPVFPWSIAQGIFIETELRGVVRGIEPAIKPRLGKEVELAAGLGIEEQGQAGIEESRIIREEEPGVVLRQRVGFEIKGAAEFKT